MEIDRRKIKTVKISTGNLNNSKHNIASENMFENIND